MIERVAWMLRGIALVSALLLSACGSGTVTTEKAAAPEVAPSPTTSTAAPKSAAVHKPHLNNPAKQPASGEVVSGTTAPSKPNQFRQRNCDTNIVANSATSCGLAENAFYEYYQATRGGGNGQSIAVHSPTTGKDYELGCENKAGLVECIGTPLSAAVYTTFPQAAIDVYTDEQAKAYANTRDVGHPRKPYTPPAPAPSEPTPSPRPESGGEDEVGSYSHAGDEKFCEEHECIGDFQGEGGYVVECSDGTYSHAGGISGSCSHHGGNG
jgi:hypothetical protein